MGLGPGAGRGVGHDGVQIGFWTCNCERLCAQCWECRDESGCVWVVGHTWEQVDIFLMQQDSLKTKIAYTGINVLWTEG